MKVAINVNENGTGGSENGTGGRCVYMFGYTYAGLRIINMRIEKEVRHMSRVLLCFMVMRITRSPYVCMYR